MKFLHCWYIYMGMFKGSVVRAVVVIYVFFRGWSYVFALVRSLRMFGGCLNDMMGFLNLTRQFGSLLAQVGFENCFLMGKYGQKVTGK